MNSAIDEMSSEMHWMKHALIEWMQAMEQGNQTISLIAKYCKNDQKRADALDMRRRKLQTDILKSATYLVDLCDEQTSLEQSLDRTAHLYRQRHLDRRQMVDTWRDTVAAMNGRDNAIREAEEVYRFTSIFLRKTSLTAISPSKKKKIENISGASADHRKVGRTSNASFFPETTNRKQSGDRVGEHRLQ